MLASSIRRPTPELVTPAAQQALTLYEAKGHLRVDDDFTADDDGILMMIEAATQACEDVMQRAILPATYAVKLSAWADTIALGPAGVRAITGIQYLDATGQDTTLASTEYTLDSDPLRAAVVPAYGKSWPAAREHVGSIRITYTAGTWAAPADIPAAVKQWILLRVGALYENREAWTSGKTIEPNPHIDGLIARWRVYSI
jgi:uncharacterized phiE125 gp8 family phage protein